MNTKIYVLTNFSQYLKSYSPIIVVSEQLLMMKRAGYEPVLIASEGWNPPEDSIFNQVKTERIFQPYIDGQTVDDQFEEEVNKLYEQLNSIFEDDSVVITHDLIFLPDYVKHNVACRRIANERPSIKWLHWVHSATNPNILIQERAMYGEKYSELLTNKFPNSMICYPNAFDIPRVAINFGYEEDEIVEVPHSTNPVEGMQPIVKRLYDAKKLSDCDVLMVYPLRLDRGKQPEMNVRLTAAFKRQGISAKLVICDFQSTGGDKAVYREELKDLATRQGVAEEVIFLSEFDEAAQLESSHQVVLDLFTLSNIFMLPSKSETYSLVAQEAMLRGNFCILNHDFSPMRQIFGDNALYRQFSSNIGFDGKNGEINTTYSDIDGFFNDMAINLKYWLTHDRMLMSKTWVRSKRNPDYIFKNHIEPLIQKVRND